MYAKSKQEIRAFNGKLIGTIYTLFNGDQEARDFYGRCVGKYDHEYDVTRDFYGRVIAKGNALAMTLNNTEEKKK